MSEAVIADRKATLGEVRDHAEAIRGKAQVLGLDPPTVRDDGIHSAEPVTALPTGSRWP